MTINVYSMSVILSATTSRMLTSVKVGGWRGLKDLAFHLGVAPRALPRAVFAQHPELDVDTTGITDWNDWMLDMVAKHGAALKFEGKGDESA